jgi:hypothetical protein
MTLTPEEIPDFIHGVLKGIKDGLVKACKEDGIDAHDPDEVSFELTVAVKRNFVSRETTTDPVTNITNDEQTTDSVTTHGRTNEEDRLNRGQRVTTHTATTEDSD